MFAVLSLEKLSTTTISSAISFTASRHRPRFLSSFSVMITTLSCINLFYRLYNISLTAQQGYNTIRPPQVAGPHRKKYRLLFHLVGHSLYPALIAVIEQGHQLCCICLRIAQ